MNDLKNISQIIEIAIRNDLACNGPMAQQMANIFGLRRSGSGGGIDVTTLMNAEKKIISIKDSEMSKENSARTVYDAIKAEVKFATHRKLGFMSPEEFKNVVLSGIRNGSIVIQGDLLGIEEQISKEIMLSNNLQSFTN